MNSLVSIVIPCFNAEPWLAATLESALAQSWPDREIIVVDDGSTDRSLSLARTFESRGVRVISQANQGASAARNAGLAVAAGDYFQFLDADDLLHERKIEAQMEKLRLAAPGTVASARWGRFDRNPAEIRWEDSPLFCDLTGLEFLISAARRDRMMHPAAWLTPRDVAAAAGPWNESLSLNDDGEYFARVALAAKQIVFCEESAVYYRSNLSASLSGRKDDTAKLSLFRSIELTAEWLQRAHDSPEVRAGIAALYLRALHANYPCSRDLLRANVARIEEFGGRVTAPVMGPKSAALARLIGWKAVRRLQERFRT